MGAFFGNIRTHFKYRIENIGNLEWKRTLEADGEVALMRLFSLRVNKINKRFLEENSVISRVF